MRAYEDFTPNIPGSEEPEVAAPVILPPAPELTHPEEQPKKKIRQEQSQRPKRPATPKKKEPRAPRKPIVESIKEWAQSQTTRWITGLFLGFTGVYLAVCFFSYFASCVADQSEIQNAPYGSAEEIVNKGGEGGARLSEMLINEGFGIGSFVIVFWFCAMALKLLTGTPRFKTVNFTIKILVALITVSLIVGLMTVGMNTTVNWGGYHGRYVNEQVIHWLGWSGALVLCVFFISLFIVICLRDVINWIIALHKRRQAKKQAEAAIEAERLAREQEIEEMRRIEERDAFGYHPTEESKEETVSIPDEVNFGEELGVYNSLPDFDEEYNEPSVITSQPAETISSQCPVSVLPNSVTSAMRGENEDDNRSEDPAYSISTVTHINNIEALIETSDDDGSYSEQNKSNPHHMEDIQEASVPEVNSSAVEEDSSETVGEEKAMVVKVNTISQAGQQLIESEGVLPGMHPYRFPPAELLREGVTRVSVDAQEQMANKERIQKTLLDFGIPIQSIEATVGPTVTLYEIIPERGVKINSIKNLGDDIALSLAAVGVRIIAPIPGKGTVGIEVANNDPQTVSMRTVIQSKAYQESKAILPVAMGSTISNDVYISDLAKMPHLLVAGATGQGKSVGLNAIVASLLYRKTPDELKFVMIDPKMVEFSLYSKLESHYLAKIPDAEDAIITDMDKVVATLSSLCVEMDDRYQLLKAAHTKNIEEYNKKIKERKLNPLEGHRFLPYIVVIVDEFSDLIMTAGKEVETPIARLAQKARAVGIHVIIATQRPSTNVITGIIKANFPARIAFKVSSGVDSKTILDTSGAQQLIGRGDMLISNNAPMERVQCAFIDTPEVEAICDYISRQPYGQGAYKLPDPVVTGGSQDGELGNNFGDRDPLFEEVARLIVNCSTASTSSLQRRYSIGYNRAGKIMDQLEAAGIVGPAQGGKPRAVLVDAITLDTILNPDRH